MLAKQEKRWLWWFILLVLVVTTIPYWLGFALQGESWRFTGFFFGVEDGNSYIAKMLSGAAGEWLFRTPYTAFPQSGMVAFLPYLLLGKLTAPPAQHEQLLALFQLFRWGGGIAMIWATYRFIAHFIDQVNLRRLGMALAIAGGGLGWLSAFGLQNLWSGNLPLEFYSPETFGFLSLLGLPHLEMARALLLMGFVYYFEYFATKEKQNFLKMIAPGVMWLLAGFMQPLTVVTGWIVLLTYLLCLWGMGVILQKKPMSIWWAEQKRRVIHAGVMLAISSPIVVYTFISFITDPFLKEWNKQNLIISPPFGDYVLAFGTLLPFIFVALLRFRAIHSDKAIFLIGWIAAFPLMAYAPINVQRRLPDGIWVALVVLALLGYALIRNNRLKILSKVWLYGSFLSSLIFLVGGVLSVSQLQPPIYQPMEQVRAFDFIRETLPANVAILAPYSSANALPAWAPVRTVIGHGPESANLKEIQPKVSQFYSNGCDLSGSLVFLREFGIKYILVTPAENQFNYSTLVQKDILHEIYNRSGYIILKVNE